MAHCGNWNGSHFFIHFPELNPYGLSNLCLINFLRLRKSRLNLPITGYRFRKKPSVKCKSKDAVDFFCLWSDTYKNESIIGQNFLNQETAFFLGTEKFPNHLTSRCFMNLYRVKRGHYEVEFTPLTDNTGKQLEFGDHWSLCHCSKRRSVNPYWRYSPAVNIKESIN